MKTKLLGTFPIGPGQATLYVSDDSGGLCSISSTMPVPEITIGLNEEAWDQVLSVLLHEAFECVAMQSRLHYEPSIQFAGENGRYLFVMDHYQFSEVCAKVGLFVAESVPVLAASYNRFKRRGKL